MEVYEVLFIRTSKQRFTETEVVARTMFEQNNRGGSPCLMLKHEVNAATVSGLLNGGNFSPPRSYVWHEFESRWVQVYPIEE